MKKIFIAALFSVIVFSCKKVSVQDKDILSPVSVAPSNRIAASTSILQWQKCLGSSSDDFGNAIAKTTDGYFVAGYTTASNGNHDAMVVKIDFNGTVIWQKIIGGSALDEASGVVATPDGGCLVTGYTQSNDGDVTGKGGGDVLLFKLLADGSKDWVKTLGGSGYDRAFAIINTLDGGYALAGNTTSVDGDVTASQVVNGIADVWLVKFNITTGAPVIDWQKTIGITGSRNDVAYALVQSPNDYSYTIAGTTLSNSSSADILIINIDASGGFGWSRIVSSSVGDVAFGIALTQDYGYIVTGYYNSNNLIAIKYDIHGNQQWQKIFQGGSGSIQGRAAVSSTAQGDIIVGFTNSKNGDIIAADGSNDMFVLRLDDLTGNKISANVLGGKASDKGVALIANADGTFVAAGNTASNNGDVSGNHGLDDFWVVKFKF